MEKSRYVRVIEEVRGDDPIEDFLPTRFRSTFWVSDEMMVVIVPQNKEVSEDGKIRGRKGIGSAIFRRRANRGSINI